MMLMKRYSFNALVSCYFFSLHLLSASAVVSSVASVEDANNNGDSIMIKNDSHRHRILDHKKKQQEDASFAAELPEDDNTPKRRITEELMKLNLAAALAAAEETDKESDEINKQRAQSKEDDSEEDDGKKGSKGNKEKRSKDDDDKVNTEYFKPGPDLDVFRNVDPAKFEWVDPQYIRPKEITCGYLKAPFGWPAGSKTGYTETPDQKQFPFVQVYVCIRFAEVQPAPRGNLFVHCGGPGSLSFCLMDMGYGMGKSPHKYGYNVISIDQRGMGRSTPTFMVKECSYAPYTQYGTHLEDLDASNVTSIQKYARLQKARNLGCWAYSNFSVPVDDQDESSKRYHFLEYSGTRQLTEDMERIRILFGGHRLSCYGVSYGTSVCATFATTFSSSIHLMVIDSNMPPRYDARQFAEDEARASDMRINYFIASCDMGHNKHCGGFDMAKCIANLHDVLDDNRHDILQKYDTPTPAYSVMTDVVKGLFLRYDLVSDVCSAAESAAENNDIEELNDLVEQLLKPAASNVDDTESDMLPEQAIQLMVSTELMPSPFDWNWRPAHWKGDRVRSDQCSMRPPDYRALTTDSENIPMSIVLSQDRGFGSYNEGEFVKFIQDIHEAYPGAGTQVPTKLAAKSYGWSYYWPHSTPLAPNGHPEVKGIISGQLFDTFTPYEWTQKMRENFPLATLLTSRFANHGMDMSYNQGTEGRDVTTDYDDPACQANIERYLMNGYVDFNDGHVCESDPVGKICTIDNIVNTGNCG